MNKVARFVLLFVGPALALGAIIVWWSTRKPELAAKSKPSALEEAAERAAKSDPRAAEVLRLTRDKGVGRSERLVELYTSLSGDKSATGVRSLALSALFGEASLALRLKGVLDAVASDDTPSREDPLWPKIKEKLAEQWTPETFDKGRDLMLAEQRPRARRALIDSFVELVETGQTASLTNDQVNALLTDLIDMHAVAENDQRPAIQGAVRRIGGDDPADLLAGKGLGPGQKLKLQAEYEKQLQAGVDTLLKGEAPAN
jgi:hypothetical protein